MEEIVKEAYRLFENYKAKRPLDICTSCCMDKEKEELLASLPVKKIPKNLLMEYNDGASTEKTPVEELKHFLPRYIELTSEFEFPSHSLEFTLRRLNPIKRDEWTDEEFTFLEKFALNFFKKCLSTYPLPEFEKIDGILIMFWKGNIHLTELLNSWRSNSSLSSTLHFKDFYFEGFKRKNPSKMNRAFGEEGISSVLRDWIDSGEVQRAFKENIERLIIDEIEIDDFQLNQLNTLYEVLK